MVSATTLALSFNFLQGKLLSRYLLAKDTLFVVSSDFCHWGTRFDYTLYDENEGPIYASIEALDKRWAA